MYFNDVVTSLLYTVADQELATRPMRWKRISNIPDELSILQANA